MNTYLSSRGILDVSSNNLARTALAQAVSYAISDYFNQYYMGYTDGTNEATRDYTVLVTFWSTLISTLILLPLAAYTSSTSSALSFTQALAVGAIGIIPGVVSEIFEELYVDPYIEVWISAQIYTMGGDEKAAQFWSMLATSFREALTGGASALINQMGSSDSNTQTQTQQQQQQQSNNPEMQLTIEKQKAENALADIDSKKAWKSLFGPENLIGIVTAIPSFFMGGGDLGVLSMALDLSTDIIQTKLQNYYLKGILTTRIDHINRVLESSKAQAALSREAIIRATSTDRAYFPARVETVPTPMPQADLMHLVGYPAPMLSIGPVFEFNQDNKAKLDTLNEKVSEELRDIQNK